MRREEEAKIRRACDRVLASATFAKAARLRGFLAYLIEQGFERPGDGLSQHAIAIDVFGRDETFDPTVDALVRVEAGRLRSKLRDYYADEGSDETVRVEIKRGAYCAAFVICDTPQAEAPSNAAPTAAPRYRKAATVDARGGPQSPTLAVLPFDSMSAAVEDEFLADGFSEDLITDLSQVPGLSVIARQSTFAFKGKRAGIAEICQALGATFVLEGSIRRLGDQLRVNAQLIDGSSESHLWAKRFDCSVEEVFSIQDTINSCIADALRLEVARQRQDRTPGLEAHDYLLIGVKEARTATLEGSARARYCFERATEIAPHYAPAWARLAFNAIYQWIAGWTDDYDDSVLRGLEMAHSAIRCDEYEPLGHAALCWGLTWSGEHDKGLQAGELALSLNPNDVDAIERMSLGLSFSRQPAEATELLKRAQQLNPLEPYYFPRGMAHFMAGDYSAAIPPLEKRVSDSPGFLPAWLFLGASAVLGGNVPRDDIAGRVSSISPRYVSENKRLLCFKYQDDRDAVAEALHSVGL